MKTKLSKKFWIVLVLFGLIGQISWVVENMYFNIFIFEEFNATANDIASMVSLSAICATITTLTMGILSDKIGKRKSFICIGYILWGLSIMAFALLKMENLKHFVPEATAISLGITLVITFDCIMTFFGSTANDACFNAWVTDNTAIDNRGKVEGINSTMPLISILVVFGSFMFVSGDNKWNIIFIAIGLIVIITGILGIFLIDDSTISKNKQSYFSNIIYGFKPKVIRDNIVLYVSFLGFSIFSISIQVFMPYLIIYYEHSLKLDNYVLIMAPAIVIAAGFTVFFGKVIDKKGFKFSVLVSLMIYILGLLILYLSHNTILVFIGSLLMMMGNLSCNASFSSIIRNNTPKNEVGMFQGIRMVAGVLLPMIIGPFIGSSLIKGGDTIINSDGTTSEIPTSKIFLGSLIVALLILIVLYFLFKITRKEKNHLSSNFTPNEQTPLPEYPRPQLKRDSYLNLNGLWEFTISEKYEIPQKYDYKILVPYPMESKASKIFKTLKKNQYIIYRKSITFDEDFIKDKALLHFGAIDQFATIYFNNHLLLENTYVGYYPLTVDITPYLKSNNELIVICKDDNNTNYPYGKQSKTSKGMWYTKISGIWQTVWCESVYDNYIKSIKLTPNIDDATIKIQSSQDHNTLKRYKVYLNDELINEDATINDTITIKLNKLALWDPDNPTLYTLNIETDKDCISSYFAMRKFSIEKVDSIKRLCLNNKPFFFNGLLDQGYYSDGIFTPGSYEAFKYDILTMKSLGFNTLRKHIKIEPLYWYYLCDKYGMIVWQDMVNNGKYSFITDTALPTIGITRKDDKTLNNGVNQDVFISSMKKTVELLYNTPSIALYTIFNEGWGQFDSSRVYNILKSLDETRFIDCNSGWFDMHINEINSKHIYFKKVQINYDDRATILSEFGGYSYKLLDHSFNIENTYGYKFFSSSQEYEDSFIKLYETEILPNIEKGLCAAIYTQVSDVEDETNGILTYDRKVCKLSISKIKQIMDKINNKL